MYSIHISTNRAFLVTSSRNNCLERFLQKRAFSGFEMFGVNLNLPSLYIPLIILLTLAKEPFWLPLGLSRTWLERAPCQCLLCVHKRSHRQGCCSTPGLWRYRASYWWAAQPGLPRCHPLSTLLVKPAHALRNRNQFVLGGFHHINICMQPFGKSGLVR